MIEYDNKDWLKLLFTFKGAVERTIWPRIVFLGIWTTLIYLFHLYVYKLEVPSTPWSIVGVALGLLLVFRTNTSYERYWEGRKMWGVIVVNSRSLSQNIINYIPDSNESTIKTKHKLLNLIIAFSFLVKQKLKMEPNIDEVKDLLDQEEFNLLTKASNPPISLLFMISKILNKLRNENLISDIVLHLLNNNLEELNRAYGACERIRSTPIPIAYALHLKRFLYLFCLTIPFSLVNAFGVWSIIISMLISYAFIGIEEIGVEIEDPFGDDPNDLPAENLCKRVNIIVNELKNIKL